MSFSRRARRKLRAKTSRDERALLVVGMTLEHRFQALYVPPNTRYIWCTLWIILISNRASKVHIVHRVRPTMYRNCMSPGLPSTLCCNYLIIDLFEVTVLVGTGRTAVPRTLLGAWGALRDGQVELMGIWPECDATGERWRSVSSDLQSRGAETIRFLGGVDQRAMDAFIHGAFRGAVPVQRIWWEAPTEASGQLRLRPSDRRVASELMALSDAFQVEIQKAVVRKGGFQELESAVSFVARRGWAALRTFGTADPTLSRRRRPSLRGSDQPSIRLVRAGASFRVLA